MKKIYAIDCETDPFLYGRHPKPFLWGCYDGLDYQEFEKSEDMAKFISETDGYFYAHNGGKFDFHFLSEWLNRDEKILMISSRLVEAKIGKGTLRDSYALLPFPLKAYGKKDIDYSKLEKRVRKKHMKEIKEYLFYDCKYLHEMITKFIDQYGMHKTAAGASIKMMVKIEGAPVENSGPVFFDKFQKFYFGGRCESFVKGEIKGPITYLDINSAYPFAMKHPHAWGHEFETKADLNPPIWDQSFYHVRARSYGAFPRRKEGGGLMFDWSGEEKEFYLTGWEIKAAQETGMGVITEHLTQHHFKQVRTMSRYIDYFWELRQQFQKGTAENLFAKLFMNSCYGKMSANPNEYSNLMLIDPELYDGYDDEGWSFDGEIGDHMVVSRPLEPHEMRFYNVATGASITGFVRAMLMRAIKAVGKPIYCDTDSLLFTGLTDLPMGKELGQWKIEGVYDIGYFAGKKLYGVKNKDEIKTASKGVRLSFDEIKEVALGGTVTYMQHAPIFSWKKENSFLNRKIQLT